MLELGNQFAAAQEAHRAGKLEEAQSLYQACVQLDAHNPDVMHFLGLVKYQRGSEQEGVRDVQRSLDMAPENPHAWNNLGNMLAKTAPLDAIAAYERATSLEPSLVQGWYNLGVLHRRERNVDDSVLAFCKAVELQPADGLVYERFGILLYGLGRFEEAARVYGLWLQRQPDSAVARHMLAAMSGNNVPERASDDYITTLFDSFSSSFDEQLKSLEYRAPELLASALLAELPAQAYADILDAGCGTGLCGPLLRSSARRLAGVDLSEGMIRKAAERGVYDELHVKELTAFMLAHPTQFDAIVSADTLVYFGALEAFAAAASQCLRPGGLLAFTLERRDAGEDYRMEVHGRYSHRAAYARQVLCDRDFTLVEQRHVVLRKEKLQEVSGLLLVARRKPGFASADRPANGVLA